MRWKIVAICVYCDGQWAVFRGLPTFWYVVMRAMFTFVSLAQRWIKRKPDEVRIEYSRNPGAHYYGQIFAQQHRSCEEALRK